MNEEKKIQISEEALNKIEAALISIKELSAAIHMQMFGLEKARVLQDAPNGKSTLEAGFAWFYDNYDILQSVMLSINTLSDLGLEGFPPEL